MVQIKSGGIEVRLDPVGGKLDSIRSPRNGIEYLWQGHMDYWTGKAPNLFPIVGRVFQSAYTWQGKRYPMKCHGFLSNTPMEVERQDDSSCTFLLRDSEATREIYPFEFELRIAYTVKDSTLCVDWNVKNAGKGVMHCAVGGHPGFNIPLEEGLAFEDYRICFPEKWDARKVEFSDGVLAVGERPYELEDGRIMRLDPGLFARDAVVFSHGPSSITLDSEKGSHGVTVSFPDMPYVGFWQVYKPGARYVCVEPWSALPGRDGVLEDLSTIPGFYAIEPEESAVNRWSIEIF